MTDLQEEKLRQIKALAFLLASCENIADIPTELLKEIGFMILGLSDNF